MLRSLAIALLVLVASAVQVTAAVEIESFSPQGFVKAPRQVVVRFSAPMVRFGDPRAGADPLEIDCSGLPAEQGAQPRGTGRWTDSRTWVFDFDADLAAGVRCRARLRASVTAVNGASVTPAELAFHTGGPQIARSDPYEGDENIDEQQAFLLYLDAPVDEASVERHAWFAVAGLHERIAARVLSGAERDQIVATLMPEDRKQTFVILQPRRRFPNSTAVTLHWPKQIVTTTGVAAEIEQTLSFKTRPELRASFSCERINARADCIPLLPFSVAFGSAVSRSLAERVELVASDGKKWTPKFGNYDGDYVEQITFVGPFPESSTLQLTIPADFHDDAGRTLANAAQFPLAVKTDSFPPLAKFAARFGLIEANAEPALPVTVRNLESELSISEARLTAERDVELAGKLSQLLDNITGKVQPLPLDRLDLIQPWLRRVGWAKYTSSVFAGGDPLPAPAREIKLPKPNGDKPFEVMGIPLPARGLYVVELHSPRLGKALLDKDAPFYVATAALVTNLAVHLKWGDESSLVWVTRLDDSQPVADAEVTVQDCRGTTLWQGRTDSEGIARVKGLAARAAIPKCSPLSDEYWPEDSPLSELNDGLFVIARTAVDLSFVHSDWDQGVDLWRFGFYDSEESPQSLAAHTIFDRSLLRVGDTVHMKHVVRRRSAAGFELPAALPAAVPVSVTHQASGQKFELPPVAFDAHGAAIGEWRVPADAKLGSYQVSLDLDADHTEIAGTFRVEQFRVPLMKASVSFPENIPIAAPTIPIDLSVSYLAGGAARQLPVTLRSQVRPRPFSSPHPFERYRFANGPVTVGSRRRGMWDETERALAEPPFERQTLSLDDAGGAHLEIAASPAGASEPSEVLAEMEFRDPAGEIQTVAATLPLWPARWLVGMEAGEWVAGRDRLSGYVAVIDPHGTPVRDAEVRVEVFRQQTFSSRKRLVGGFYGYEHVTEISGPIGQLCQGKTGANGMLVCDGAAPAQGALILQATATDPEGRDSSATQEVWIYGDDDTWFDVSPSDRMDILPQQLRYEPGEQATIQVRMPFRNAKALVTVEREGILDAFTVELSGKEPVVRVPMKPEYAPNVYVTVTALRGRVGDVQPTAKLDLGRPAFKLGITELEVGWRGHELQVSVKPDAEVHRVRERANVRIAVHNADGSPLASDTEVAVAAVDAGLLELAPNRSWKLLDAMMARRDLAVATSSAQLHVIGKRHFGLKALPNGGGGGRQTTRELFDTLLYWNPRVPVQPDGTTAVDIPLNDSLTSFEIVAVATAGLDRFGTGNARLRTTQDLMVLPGLAPIARAGDRFGAEITVRNASEQTMVVQVAGVAGAQPLAERRLTLAAGAAQVVAWDIAVPAGVDRLEYEFTAEQADAIPPARDSVRFVQQVVPAVPVRTYQASLSQLRSPLRAPVQAPLDALPGRGGVKLTFSRSLVEGLDGVRSWMRDYPYTCLEQRTSVAIALRDRAGWDKLVQELPAYVAADGLLKYFPSSGEGSDSLTAYVLALSAAAEFPLPAPIRKGMVEALEQFVQGKIEQQHRLSFADLPLRKMAALAALARVGAARPALLASIALEPQLWPSSTLVDWLIVLDRVAAIPNCDAKRAQAEQLLRARLSQQGGALGFSSEHQDRLWWLMVTPDIPQLRLILELCDQQRWPTELPQLVRAAVLRQRSGRWDTTVSNAWGTLALECFSRRFEKQRVAGTTVIALASQSQRLEWPENEAPAPQLLSWPEGAATLEVAHTGSGAPWLSVQSLAAVPLSAPLNAGYRITRRITPIEQHQPGRLSKGDVVRVTLDIEASTDMSWVVIDDPIPAGATILGSGLGRDSQLLNQTPSANTAEWWWNQPTYIERRNDSYRAYYEYVAKGSLQREYALRLNQSGTFPLPPTRVEALYAPEMFAELPNAAVEVAP